MVISQYIFNVVKFFIDLKINKGLAATFLLCIFASLISVACQRTSDPRRTLGGCLDAIMVGNFEKVYNYFSFEDQSVKSVAEFIRENELSAGESSILKISSGRIFCDIKELSVIKDSARAIIEVAVPDIMFKRFESLFYEINKNQRVDSMLNPEIKNGQFYINTIEGVVYLIREPEGWRIRGNWEEQRRKEAEESKIRLEYIQNKLKIKNIEIAEYKGDRGISLTATIKNLGQRTLKDVEIFVICLDGENRACYSVTEHPISGLVKPLKPKTSRRFKIDLTTAPTNWSKRVEIKIVNCKFAQ